MPTKAPVPGLMDGDPGVLPKFFSKIFFVSLAGIPAQLSLHTITWAELCSKNRVFSTGMTS
jgi:hypothetical protein